MKYFILFSTLILIVTLFRQPSIMLLTKCCCCCNLKYGYFAYGILSMAARLMLCISLYHASVILVGPFVNTGNPHYQVVMAQVISIYGGWVLTSAVCLFFTLKGIVQERSILIFPYIVVLVVELIGLLISGILSAVYASAYYLLFVPFVAAILIYELWSLISLFKHMKNDEKIRNVEDISLFKTV